MINKKEMVHQINTTSFYVYIPKSTIMYVTCSNKQQEEKHEIWGYSIITLKPGCKASIQEHIFSAGIKVEERTSLKYMNININLRDLLKIGRQEEAELLEVIHQEGMLGNQPAKITAVKKKYNLRKLQKHNRINSEIFVSTYSIIVIAIIIIAAIMIRRRCTRNRITNPVIRMNELTSPTSVTTSISGSRSNYQTPPDDGVPFVPDA